MSTHLFTSESVGEGHPDKICDQISDAVLDAAITVNPDAHVACECFVTTNFVLVGGETNVTGLNIDSIVRNTIRRIGYTYPDIGFAWDTVVVINMMHEQSADIDMGVSQAVQGAGDQGIMFGYANSDTNALMPMPIYLAHNLMRKAADVRRLPGGDILRPDAKSQVTVEYEDNKPVKVRNVVLSHQHAGDADVPALRQMLYETVIQPTIRDAGFDVAFDECLINPTGRFAIGGPNGDTGLTGRKIIVDTYGGMGRHAGGAFSGKDPSKVDRSAAYMARHIAKALVANRYATECEVQLAYAIGIARPTSLYVNTFGTGTKSDAELEVLVRDHFDCTPAGIINTLDLKRPIYESTASYGHFGRAEFSWEDTAIL